MEAELLGELWMCQAILLQVIKPALRFCCEGRSVLLHAERAFCVSINCYNCARSWHFHLEVRIVLYRIESSECGSSEQCMIATSEGDDVED